MPSFAKPTITSNTSCTISGSRAEVGSSNSITMGSMLNARAMATRCCCPPDNWAGNLCACALKPTRSKYAKPFFSASSLLRPNTLICATVKLSLIDKWGNNSKCWNTMPTWLRNLGKWVLGSASEVPATTISPF